MAGSVLEDREIETYQDDLYCTNRQRGAAWGFNHVYQVHYSFEEYCAQLMGDNCMIKAIFTFSHAAA